MESAEAYGASSNREARMSFTARLGLTLAGIGICCSGVWAARLAPAAGPLERDKAAIERLHQQDIEATLSDKADELAKLWDRDAVRLQAGSPAEVGRDVIYANDKRWEANLKGGRTFSYKPEIRDLQIAGDWAFEWDDFDVVYKASATAEPTALHGKALRVLKKQSDGSWRFARVMAVVDPVARP
jgi:ketosteroid isomerase-like protein